MAEKLRQVLSLRTAARLNSSSFAEESLDLVALPMDGGVDRMLHLAVTLGHRSTFAIPNLREQRQAVFDVVAFA